MMKMFISAKFQLPVILILSGSFLGLSVVTINYAHGASYLGNDSASCANCHRMQGHFDA